MSEHLKALLAQVLALPESDRFELLNQILESLDAPEDVDASWRTEIRSRLEQLRAGSAELVEWADARKTILGSPQ